jgi:hypothetical protein
VGLLGLFQAALNGNPFFSLSVIDQCCEALVSVYCDIKNRRLFGDLSYCTTLKYNAFFEIQKGQLNLRRAVYGARFFLKEVHLWWF